jgi:hypothetical protein
MISRIACIATRHSLRFDSPVGEDKCHIPRREQWHLPSPKFERDTDYVYPISRTASEDDVNRGRMDDRSAPTFAVMPAPLGAPLRGVGA